MRRLRIFVIILAVALAVLLALVAVSLFLSASSPSSYQSSWIGQMWQSMGLGKSTAGGNNGGMGGMMGGNGSETTSTTNLWIIPITIIAAAIIGIIGLGFYLVYPEIRNARRTCEPTKKELALATATTATKTVDAASSVSNVAPNSCEVLLKTMTPEEQKVLNTLIAHQGKYLQKYLGKEAGLTRLKTHRIVARFAERGIVSVKPLGNTNEVTISDWVNNSKSQSSG